MKKTILIITLATLLTFSGCSTSKSTMALPESTAAATAANMVLRAGEIDYDVTEAAEDIIGDVYDVPAPYETGVNTSFDQPTTGSDTVLSNEKIIHTAMYELETLEFDQTTQQVENLVMSTGGYIESSSIIGNNYDYYARDYARNATYVLRVPTISYKGVQDAIVQLGNVTNKSTSAKNVALEYYDNESRLEAYKIEEERLLSMLEKCETVEDMISIESRLSDVRYRIESLTTTLKKLQNQVDYSTITLHVSEVFVYSPEPEPVPMSFGEEIVKGFSDSVKDMITGAKNWTVFLISSIPYLILPAIIVIIVVIVWRKMRKKAKLAYAPLKTTEIPKTVDNINNTKIDKE